MGLLHPMNDGKFRYQFKEFDDICGVLGYITALGWEGWLDGGGPIIKNK